MTFQKPDLRTVIEHYGGHIPTTSHRGIKMRCFLPGHEDTRPSATFNEEKGYYKCFTCDTESMDSIAVIERMESCDFKCAVAIGAEKFDGSYSTLSGAATQQRRRTPLRISEYGAGSEPRNNPPVQARSGPRRKRVT